MKLAYTIWTWGIDKEEDFLQALKDLESLDFKYFENFIGMADMYMGREDEFNKIVSDHNLEFVAIYNYVKDMKADNLAESRKYIDFCTKTGAKYMNIQAPARSLKDEENHLQDLARIFNEIGEAANEAGIRLCLHPHFDTTVESADEIDEILTYLDYEKVGLCLDTAHTVLAGVDVADYFRKKADYIDYVHLKDIDPEVDIEAYRQEWESNFDEMQRFYELGTQGIDFQAVFDVLAEIGYEGYVVLENDTPSVSNYEGAVENKKFIDSTGFSQ